MNDRLPALPAYDAPPLESQQASLLLFATPDMWFNRIMELNDQIIKWIEDGGETLQGKINGLSEWQAATIGAAIGLVGGGPLGGVVGGLSGALLINKVKDWLNGKLGELMEDLWDAHKKLVDAMQAAIDGIFGNPEKLMGLGQGYQQGKTSLNNAAFDVGQASDTLAIFWQGRGYTAYSGAAGQQKAAMEAVADKMSSASHLMADAAEMIQQCWSDIIQALVALVADIADTLLGEIEITKLPTATVTAPVGIIVDGVNFINAVVTAMRNVNIEARNSGVMNWTDLSSGDKSLDNGKWPEPSRLAENQYGNDDNWGTTDR